MNHSEDLEALTNEIFTIQTISEFERIAISIFKYQYRTNLVYKTYVDSVGIDTLKVARLNDIPFLPIRFFKSHEVVVSNLGENYIIFKSSSTTSDIPSKHIVKYIKVYETSFRKGFKLFYGTPEKYCVLALLPSYLERGDSSLVYMVADLIKSTGNPDSGFHMNDYEELAMKLTENEMRGQKTLLIGVTYALLKLAEEFPMELKNTIIMETGGMKGRREELTRPEVHEILKNAFQLSDIHSEYGMTELLSQAYSNGKGVFKTVPWMQVLIRDIYDPLNVGLVNQNGAINIIDLANLHSCSFIATDDVGTVDSHGQFEVLGRLDNSDIRGCNLMSL